MSDLLYGKSLRSGRRLHVMVTLVLLGFAANSPSYAVQPDEMLRDPELEARARTLSQDLRCVVCQNQNIDDSNAPLARDLRVLLRDRLTAGDSDRQAIAYIVARYGNFVLLKPPIQANTLLLWIGPLLVLIAAGLGFGRFIRRSSTVPADAAAPAPLSADELKLINAILEERSSA
jgi:cytochrome c-type biogenesis protein CcmH